LRDELRPERELCAFRLPLLARALVVRAREEVLRLLRPELAERERADAERLPVERALAVREPLRLAAREPPLRLDRDEPEREERERVAADRDEPDREGRERVAVDRGRAFTERVRACDVPRPRRFIFASAVLRLTSLLKRLLPVSS
jgi:hypothetical protein